jgi:hypothetical protein
MRIFYGYAISPLYTHFFIAKECSHDTSRKKFTCLEKLFSLPLTSYEDFISFCQHYETQPVGGRKYYIRRVSVKSNKLFFACITSTTFRKNLFAILALIQRCSLAKLKKFGYVYAYARQLS